jgi:hypothetical protein
VTNERNRLAGFDHEGHIFQNPVFVFVSEPDVFELNAAFSATRPQRFGRRRDENRQSSALKMR